MVEIHPQLIVLQPTTYCNINCSYCYLARRDLKKTMALEVIEAVKAKVIDPIADLEKTVLVWHGGEPTAAGLPWFIKAYETLSGARSRGLRFAIQTNGIAINPEWLALFKETETALGFSIDGPCEFHDANRRTRAGGRTWHLALRGLKLAQSHGFHPNVISVITAAATAHAGAFYDFYRSNGITTVSLSMDELEGANTASSHSGQSSRTRMANFISELLELAWRDSFPLRIKEVERIASLLGGNAECFNEQVSPWAMLTVTVEGNVSTFSPELMEQAAPQFGNFCFGNVLTGGVAQWQANPYFQMFRDDVTIGLQRCREQCSYFPVCGGGSPVNKVAECGTAQAAETDYCRITTQAAADGLAQFVLSKRALNTRSD